MSEQILEMFNIIKERVDRMDVATVIHYTNVKILIKSVLDGVVDISEIELMRRGMIGVKNPMETLKEFVKEVKERLK